MVVSGSRRRFSLILLLVCACTLNVFAAAKRKKKPTPVKQEQPAPAPAIVEAPPAELTLEQKPAVPPKVTYQNNQLTIVAENSTLGDVLRAVKVQTGATIDLPANTNARVVANLGPGPSRDVLAHLLNGTLFNYVLLGTVNDPAAVGKIILIPKPVGNEAQTAANVSPQQQNYPAVNQPGQGDDLSEAQDAEAPTEEETPANTTEQPEQPEQPGAAAPNGQQPNLRTPEQLLQELQRQQILQQQMQQQQGNPQQPNQQPAPEPNQEQ